MYICFGCDNNYVQQTGIAIISLFDNNRNLPIEQIILLDYGITESNIKILEELVSINGSELVVVDALSIMDELNKDIGLEKFGSSLATYSRAFIDKLVPSYINRILYLDSDIVVSGALEELEEIDMTDKAMACVIANSQYDKSYDNKEINLLSGNQIYYQCGVVLYNLEVWRKNDCSRLTAETSHRLKSFRNADQTLINNALPASLFMSIPPKYNYWGHIFPKHRERYEMLKGGFWTDKEINDAMTNPAVIHYKSAYFRPWIKGSLSRRNEIWRYYNSQSVWKDVPLKKWKESIPYPKTGHFKWIRAYHPVISSIVPFPWMSKAIEKIGNVVYKR